MHKHRDDIDNVPFLFLTPTRRPISRPSSRASTHSARLIPNRPDTPNSAPSSPLAMIFRRPHTPLTSPLGIQAQSSSYISARSESPGASPIFTHAQFAVSLPSSPMSSPRLLNAKASEFRPIPRPLSAASSNPGSLAALRADTPSPDMWAPPSRPTSKLAIAAPLTPDSSLLPRAFTPTSSLRSSMRPDEHDDEDDPFDPFAARAIPRSFHSSNSDELLWGNSPMSSSSLSADDMPFHHVFGGTMDHNGYDAPKQKQDDDEDPEMAAMLTDGMTPFDVLSSVFGATLAPSELEEALAANGYDFERAMTWLVDRSLTSHPTPSQPRVQSVGNRVMVVQRDGHAGMMRGGRAAFHGPQGRNGGRFVNGRPAPGGNRVCRYFLAGECLRADCRFRSVPTQPSLLRDIDALQFILAMTLNVRCVVSGSGVPARRARRASSCTISLRRLTSPGSTTQCPAWTFTEASRSQHQAHRWMNSPRSTTLSEAMAIVAEDMASDAEMVHSIPAALGLLLRSRGPLLSHRFRKTQLPWQPAGRLWALQRNPYIPTPLSSHRNRLPGSNSGHLRCSRPCLRVRPSTNYI